mmetsp:Transcript_15562/g.48922  ORF Transcript_15562/g.48922 Transcript_15562/m.48922 type:complete len:243 (-) Transcript_15562:314-1042(-)
MLAEGPEAAWQIFGASAKQTPRFLGAFDVEAGPARLPVASGVFGAVGLVFTAFPSGLLRAAAHFRAPEEAQAAAATRAPRPRPRPRPLSPTACTGTVATGVATDGGAGSSPRGCTTASATATFRRPSGSGSITSGSAGAGAGSTVGRGAGEALPRRRCRCPPVPAGGSAGAALPAGSGEAGRGGAVATGAALSELAEASGRVSSLGLSRRFRRARIPASAGCVAESSSAAGPTSARTSNSSR